MVNWETMCSKGYEGLGIWNLQILNKAWLGKWLWRFSVDIDKLWKTIIVGKFGDKGGWCFVVRRGVIRSSL